MTDATTQKPLHVSADGTAGPYIMLPVGQLAHVEKLLARHNIRYWVDAHAISLDGGPEMTVINLGHGGDAVTVQQLLDRLP